MERRGGRKEGREEERRKKKGMKEGSNEGRNEQRKTHSLIFTDWFMVGHFFNTYKGYI